MGLDPLILNLELIGGEWLTSCLGLCNRKEPQYPFNRTLVGPQSLTGHFGEEKNLGCFPGISP